MLSSHTGFSPTSRQQKATTREPSRTIQSSHPSRDLAISSAVKGRNATSSRYAALWIRATSVAQLEGLVTRSGETADGMPDKRRR